MKTLATIVAVTATLALSHGEVRGEDSPLECAPTDQVDKYRLLRQLTIDLLDRIPTMDEYEAIESLDVIDEATITRLVTSEEYFVQVRDYHRSLLWAGLDESLDIVGGSRRFRRFGQTNTWRIQNMRRRYRGNNTVECLDQLQTNFDVDGRPIPISTFNDPACTGGVCQQEGYVMVTPYWNPLIQLKVCAFDAQEQLVGLDGVACGPYRNDPGCGCGTDLRHCLPPPTDPVQVAIHDALKEEPTRIFESVIRDGRSYFDGFTQNTTFINGPLAHFYNHLSGADIPLTVGNLIGYDGRAGAVPDVPFEDETWFALERDSVHAGVLTTPGFHLRFPSNRSRVNRFYSAFRCEPFVPSDDGLPPETQEVPNPNLRERDGCATCHVTLERAAAHWGQWRTNGEYGFMSAAEVEYDAPRPECIGCSDGGRNCSSFCKRYFFTGQTTTHPDELAAWEGYPLSRGWLDPNEAAQITVGPAGFATEQGDRDKIATCTVRTLAEHLLNRELSESELFGWLPEKTEEFAASNYNFTELLKLLITDERYRTLR